MCSQMRKTLSAATAKSAAAAAAAVSFGVDGHRKYSINSYQDHIGQQLLPNLNIIASIRQVQKSLGHLPRGNFC